ncbi:tetratricopeptide repeat protein [Rhodopila sp.]|uniref:tetratricopeptide repeat protein n=1 Tax=Rhodopila sp. TaxID=2480087 RepID=UPI003D0D8D8F
MAMGLISAWRSWLNRSLVLRDVERHAADVREVDRFKVKDQLTYANLALDNNDHRLATEIWVRLMADHRTAVQDTPLALRILLRLRRFDEATTIMRHGQQRSPRNPRFLQGLGQIAQVKGDHDEAIRIFASLRKKFPGVMEGYTLGAESLKAANRLDEAEHLVGKAMKNFNSHIAPFLEYARIAMLRQDWEEALQRWRPLQDQFAHVAGFVGAAQALVQLGRHDAAEQLLQVARYRFGSSSEPLSEYARVAEARGDNAEAARRWNDVLSGFPLDMRAYITASEAFERLDEPKKAEAALRAAIDRFPTEIRPMLDLARLMQIKRRNFPAAAEAWAAVRATFPDKQEAYTSGAEALRRSGNDEQADALLEAHRIRFNSI